MEAHTKERAMRRCGPFSPSTYRSQAKIVKLNKFTLEEIEELLRWHGD
jgi:hypothetical protein